MFIFSQVYLIQQDLYLRFNAEKSHGKINELAKCESLEEDYLLIRTLRDTRSLLNFTRNIDLRQRRKVSIVQIVSYADVKFSPAVSLQFGVFRL